MRRSLLIAAVVLLFAASALAANDCELFCYNGTVGDLVYSASVVPCAPARVVAYTYVLDGVSKVFADEPVFECQSSGDAASLTLTFNTSTDRLSYNYDTTDTCEDIIAGLSSLSGYTTADHIIGGTEVLVDDNDLVAAQVECNISLAEAVSYDTCAYTAVSETPAPEGSPCGFNTTTCEMKIVFTRTAAGVIDSLDVIVRPGASQVLLSAFNPAALANPALACDAGVLTLTADGVLIEWAAPTDNSASCEVLLAYLNTLGSGNASVSFVIVDPDTESQWTADSELRSIKGSHEWSSVGSSNADDDFASNQITTGVRPYVYCNQRDDNGNCCVIYGYRNDNLVEIINPYAHGKNYVLPYGGIDLSAPGAFAPNTTTGGLYYVGWPCHQFVQHFKTWKIITTSEDGKRKWDEEAVANRERNDCVTKFDEDCFEAIQASSTP